MKHFFKRQPAVPRTDSTPAGERQADAGTEAGALQRRRFTRAMLLGVPVAAAAVATTAEPQPAQAATASDSWKMEGNANVDGNDFLGTTNTKPLVVKTNNKERMRIREDGLVGIGTAPGSAQLAVFSSSSGAIRGETSGTNAAAGVLGISISRETTGSTTAGVRGAHLVGGIGVIGTSDTSIGGDSASSIGVKGAVGGSRSKGVHGEATGQAATGVSAFAEGADSNGVNARATGERSAGLRAEGRFIGVSAVTEGADGAAVTALARATSGRTDGVFSKVFSPDGFAGVFVGNVTVNGTLSKSAGAFKIDHPLDPANKYLYHSFVESPDMMNVYNGNVTLDANGEATVELPAWCEALCRDWRYQLTALDAPGPKLHIAKKIKNNRFRIAGGQAGAEVSWQVTGIRQDAYANAHRVPVEQDKPADERGTFLNPSEHGQPEQRGLHFERIQQRVAAVDADER